MENKFFYEVLHKNHKPKSATSLHTINDVLVSRSNKEIQQTHTKVHSEKMFLGYIMDRFKKQQCFVTLKRLMLNPDGEDFKDSMASKRLSRHYSDDISGMFIILKLCYLFITLKRL